MWSLLLLAPFLALSVALLIGARRPLPEGRCLRCGYRLLAGQPLPCPECGLTDAQHARRVERLLERRAIMRLWGRMTLVLLIIAALIGFFLPKLSQAH